MKVNVLGMDGSFYTCATTEVVNYIRCVFNKEMSCYNNDFNYKIASNLGHIFKGSLSDDPNSTHTNVYEITFNNKHLLFVLSHESAKDIVTRLKNSGVVRDDSVYALKSGGERVFCVCGCILFEDSQGEYACSGCGKIIKQ